MENQTNESELSFNNNNDLATPPDEMTLDDLEAILTHTIKYDRDNKLITFLCMLSAYTDDSQLNVSFNAPSSSGKTYMTTEIAKLFPEEDKIERSGASPTSFFYSEGKVDKKLGVKVVSLERKILIFYEQPNPELQKKLRPVLSHDQRDLKFSNTNKDRKGANRAEQTIIRGFPATVFCSAGLQLDEQEATRAILLSPEVTEAKLREGVHLQFIRNANGVQFESDIESLPDRIALMNRIVAIREEKVDDIIIAEPEEIEKRFYETFTKLKPRHMRDSGHLMKLIKAVALLNVWHRRQADGTIVANGYDIDQAFQLWSTVIESQDLNVPPAVMNFYKNFILPAYLEKQDNQEYGDDVRDGLVGLSSHELSAYYMRRERTTLNDEQLRKQMIPQLVNSGMIAFEQPTYGDRRSRHIFPKWGLEEKNSKNNPNNVGEGGGVLDDMTDEEWEMFFGKKVV